MSRINLTSVRTQVQVNDYVIVKLRRNTRGRQEVPQETSVGKLISSTDVLVYSAYGQPQMYPTTELVFLGFAKTFEELEEEAFRVHQTNLQAKIRMKLPTMVTRVIVSGPATIVFFSDGDKVVVKREPKDKEDPEKAFAMCLAKKFLKDNGSSFYKEFNRF